MTHKTKSIWTGPMIFMAIIVGIIWLSIILNHFGLWN